MTQEGSRRLLPLARCYQPTSQPTSYQPAPSAGSGPPPAGARAAHRRSSNLKPMASAGDDTPPRKLKLESEDSSYDSDYEPPTAADHDDVSRTVSDTLGAEFAEYVTLGQGAYSPAPPPPGCDPADYQAKVEFAYKLGYTEEHVQRALRKLGAQPGENDFLEELIRVGKDAKGVTCDAEDHEEFTTLAPALRLAREAREDPSNLRHIVVDGSNVAMSHGNKERFSCRGIRLAVDYFRARGHQGITVFVPMWRKEAPRPDTPITDQEVLLELERERVLVFTPSRVVTGKRITCYDDRYILQTALDQDGVVVSNDNYRDLCKEKQFKKIIEERIIMYTFANDRFMPPDDPLGRNGPTLDNFLRKSPRPSESLCPYGKKCTYGNKCKYYHPERGNQPQKSVTEKLAEHAQRSLQGRRALGDGASDGGRSIRDKTLSLPASEARAQGQARKQPVGRTRSLVPGSVPGDSRPPPVDDLQQQQQLRAANKSRSMENVASAARLRSVLIDPASYDPTAAAAGGAGDWPRWGLPPPQPQQQQHMHTKGVRQHLELCRKSSDPSYQTSGGPPPLPEQPRPHKPLARQLTLNPTYDPRLAQHERERDQYVLELEAQLGRQQMMSRNLLSPHWGEVGGHRQQQQPQHASVTRIASAPDSCRQPAAGAPQLAPPGFSMQRLSSTSDPQLNAYPPPAYHYPSATDPFTADNCGGAWQQHRPVTSSPSSGWPTAAPSAYSQPPPATYHPFQSNPLTASLSTPPLGGATSQSPGGVSLSSAGGAPFGMLGFGGGAAGGYTPDPIGTQPSSPRQSKDEQRRKMYWHLSALFPEEKVRVAMNLMPDETDPTKICAEILQ